MDAVRTFRQAEQPSRTRLKSAPPVLFAAMKYGRQLRRITDEFDTLLNKGVRLTGTGLLFSHLWPTMRIVFLPPCLHQMIRLWNGRAVSQKRPFPVCLSFLWSRKESDAERRSH